MTLRNWADVYNERALRFSDPLEICEFYAGQQTCPPEWFSAVADVIATSLELRPQDSVLEVGCGCGVLMRHVLPRAGRFVGIDAAELPLQVARKDVPEATFMQAFAESLPFPNAEFDACFCYQVLHLLGDMDIVRQSCREMLRVVKPGGRVLLGQIPDAAKHDEYQAIRRQRTFQRAPVVQHDLKWLWFQREFFEELKPQVRSLEITTHALDADPSTHFRFNVRIVV